MLNYGHLVGEVIRRITGQRLGEFFAAAIAGPPGADFHIGLPPSEFHRVANVVPPQVTASAAPADVMQPDTTSVVFKTTTNPIMSAETTWTEGWRRPTSARPTATVMPARWRASSRPWLAAAQSMASGCSRLKRSTESSRCNSTGSTS